MACAAPAWSFRGCTLKHKLQSKKVKQFCQLFCIMYTFQIKLMIFLGLPLENRVLLFAWIKAKEHSDITGRHKRPVDWNVTEGVITTRSNRMKLRLIYWIVALIWCITDYQTGLWTTVVYSLLQALHSLADMGNSLLFINMPYDSFCW